MSCSASQSTPQRPFLLGSLLVFCFICLFISYMDDITYTDFGRVGRICPAFLCIEKLQNNDSIPSSSTELHNETHSGPTEKLQAAAVDAESDTVVLIWMWPFGFRFELNCDIFNFKRCHLTDDKELYHKAHGVVFHHRDIHGNLENMPKVPRPVFQKWVWSNMESPTNSGKIAGLNELFNLTSNYRRDSSIPVPYGNLYPVTSTNESFKLPAKDKLVCWIVSNWSPNMKRVQYYNELKKHVTIHAYGGAFQKPVGNEDFVKIMSSCKFYLSFENSFHRDYITEKFFNPLTWGSVPVVMGPPRHMYEGHAPAESFIHVDDFPSPKELAERLLYLDQNQTEYMRFFNWRSMFKVKRDLFGREIACKTCRYLQNHKEYQAFNDLNTWYWG
ncbi:4-galactosyl-N-acetylglucosaminide 3-alpha-L-fucosyltransferase 9-like [Pungitius pungitius]|uniref:4-galactosyl-N-acetylglucosaminide 3-alpha-L-fucosyltransferase 9-like n=1 Tax=Pungitius pungitius TaxID=134920 RepID=UPI002E10FA77